MFLVNDTLDYFQIKSGKFVRQDKTFKLETLVEGAMEMITHQMRVKGLQKKILIDSELLDLDFYFDVDRISQVLVNLLSNALKFTF